MVALFVAPCIFWVGWAPVFALLLGYASHLLGDAATKSGVRLFYPSMTRIHLLPKNLRITIGPLAEDGLLPFVALGASLLLLSQLFGS